MTDAFDIMDRLGGIATAMYYQELGKQVRIRHAKPDAAGKTPQGQTGNEIAAMLKRYGVPCWWKRATKDHLIFNVRAKQWQWTVDLLATYGADVDHKARPWTRTATMPVAWKDRR